MGLYGFKVFGIFLTISCVAAQPRPSSGGFTVPSFTDIMRDVTQLEAAVSNFEQSSGGTGSAGIPLAPLGGAGMPLGGPGMPLGGAGMPLGGAGVPLGGAAMPQDGFGAGVQLGGASFPQDGVLGPAVSIPSAGDPLTDPSINMDNLGNPTDFNINSANPITGFDIHGNPVGSPQLDPSVLGPSGAGGQIGAPLGESSIDNLINELGASGVDMFGQGNNPLGGPSATIPGAGIISNVDISGASGNVVGPSTVPIGPSVFHGTNVHSSEQPVDPTSFVDLNINVAVPTGLGAAGSVDLTNAGNVGSLPVIPNEFAGDSTIPGISPQDGFVADPSLLGPLPALGGGPSGGFLGGAQIDPLGNQINSGSVLPGGGMLPPAAPVDVPSVQPTVPHDGPAHVPHGEPGTHVGSAHVDMPGEHGNPFDFPIVHRTSGPHATTHAEDATHVDTPLPGVQPAIPATQPGDHMHLPTDPLSGVAPTPTVHDHGSAHVDMPNEHGNPFDFPIVHRTNGTHSHGATGHSGLPATLPGIPTSLPGSIPTPHNDAGHTDPHVDLPGQHGNTLTEPSLHLPPGMSIADLSQAEIERLRDSIAQSGPNPAIQRPHQPPVVPSGPAHVDIHGPGEVHIDQPGQHGNTNSESSLHLPPGVTLSDLTPAQLARLGLGNQRAQGPSIPGTIPQPSAVETGLGHVEPAHGHDHSSGSHGTGDIHIDQPGEHGNTLSEAAVHLPPGMSISDLTPAQLARLGITSSAPTDPRIPTPGDLSPPFGSPGVGRPGDLSPPFGSPGVRLPDWRDRGRGGLPDWRDRGRGGMMPGARVDTGVLPGAENVPIPNERRRLRNWLRRLRNRRNRRRRILLNRTTTTTTTTTTPAPPRQIGIVIRRNRPNLNVGGLLSSLFRTASQIGRPGGGGGGLLGSVLNSAARAQPGRPIGPVVSFGGPPTNNFGGLLSRLLG